MLGIWPTSNGADPFLKLGVASWNAKLSSKYFSGEDEMSGSDLFYGIGVKIGYKDTAFILEYIGSNFTFDGAVDDETTTTTMTVGFEVRFL